MHTTICVSLQTEKFSNTKKLEKQREDDLKKVLHRSNANGYLTDEEKTSNIGSLPGMRTRKRQSVGRSSQVWSPTVAIIVNVYVIMLHR